MQLLVLGSIEILPSGGHGQPQTWLRVQLPIRPNGTSGWVPADDVELFSTPWQVHVSTERRLVEVYRGGRLVRRFGAVVGKSSTPTPHGRYAVNEVIRQADPRAFLGPWALHLTAFSNALFNFGGGPGRVAIHGRGGLSLRDPLGSSDSHGCVRVENANIIWMSQVAVPGTPVQID